MAKLLAGLVIAGVLFTSCGDSKDPNQQACEGIRDNAEGSEEEKLQALEEAARISEGDLKSPVEFVLDFARQNPDFGEGSDTTLDPNASLEESMADLEESMRAISESGPVIEASMTIAAECAKVGVALPMGE